MTGEFLSEERIIRERKLIGALPETVPAELIELLADELEQDPGLYFERKQRAKEITPILDELSKEE